MILLVVMLLAACGPAASPEPATDSAQNRGDGSAALTTGGAEVTAGNPGASGSDLGNHRSSALPYP